MKIRIWSEPLANPQVEGVRAAGRATEFCIKTKIKLRFAASLLNKRRCISLCDSKPVISPVTAAPSPANHQHCAITAVPVAPEADLVPGLNVILVCYFNVFLAVCRHNSTMVPCLLARRRNPNPSTSLAEIRVTRLLFAVLVGFLLCWTPVLVIGALGHALVPLPLFTGLAYTGLALTSSVTNPFIYGVMNRAFRKEFLKILRCTR